MFSVLHKEENAHEEGIWACNVSRINVSVPKSSDDNEDDQDKVSSDKTETYKDFIVTGGMDDLVKVWDLEDGRINLKHQLAGHSLGVVSVAVSSDGKTIASSSLDSSLCFWETESGLLKKQINLGALDVWTLDFSPCNTYVISGCHDGKISMYNVESGNVAQILDPQNGKFTLSIAYSPDGKYIATGAIDGIINIFDISTGKVAQTLEGHAMPVRSLCFSPNSQLLLTGSDDGHMKLYDVAHSDIAGTLSGHASWVLCVDISSDGRRFASSSSDKTVKIWEISEKKCLHTFHEHTDQVWGVKYSCNNDYLISVSEDKMLNLYNCPPQVIT